MKTPQRTERITFLTPTLVSDGGAGTLPGEDAEHSTLATVEILKGTRLLEAMQTTLRQGYRFGIWVNPDFEPEVGQTIRYRDERLSIQAYRYEDNTHRRYLIDALEQPPHGT